MMRFPFRSVAVALSLAAAATAHGITLSNPSFETPASGNPDSWGAGGTVDAGDVSADFAHDGSQSLKYSAIVLNQNSEFYNPNFTGSGDNTTPITFNTWVYKPSGNPITNHFIVLGLEFKKLNVPGNPGGGDSFVSYDEQVFETNNVAADTWTPLAITRTAAGPWDVLILHIKLVGLQPADQNPSGVVYVDDVSVVPEPAAAALIGLGASALLARPRRD